MNPAIMRGVWRARGPLSKFDFLFILVEVVTHVCTTRENTRYSVDVCSSASVNNV